LISSNLLNGAAYFLAECGKQIDLAESYISKVDKHRSSLTGAVRYIEKPSQLEEFLSTVGRAVKEMLEA
jgi:hypothetical protein